MKMDLIPQIRFRSSQDRYPKREKIESKPNAYDSQRESRQTETKIKISALMPLEDKLIKTQLYFKIKQLMIAIYSYNSSLLKTDTRQPVRSHHRNPLEETQDSFQYKYKQNSSRKRQTSDLNQSTSNGESQKRQRLFINLFDDKEDEKQTKSYITNFGSNNKLEDGLSTTKAGNLSILNATSRPDTSQIQQITNYNRKSIFIPQSKRITLIKQQSKGKMQVEEQSQKIDHVSILQQLYSEQTENIESLMKNKLDTYFTNMVRIASIAVDINDLSLLEFFIALTAELMLEIKSTNISTFFFNQLRIFQSYTMNHKGKCNALIGLADCCTQLHQASASIIFLKRALQYAWMTQDTQSELNIYEKMAMNYFYLSINLYIYCTKGLPEKSNFFHSRALLGGLENQTSPVKHISLESLSDYAKGLSFTFNDITTLLLTYLGIPLFTVEEFIPILTPPLTNYVNGQTPRAFHDTSKKTLYQKTVGRDLIDYILRSDQDFKASIPTPKCFIEQINILVTEKTNFAGNVGREVAQAVRLNKHIFSPTYFTKNSGEKQVRKFDQTLFKFPLNKQIEMRLKSPPKQEDLGLKLQEGLKKAQLNEQELLRSPINLNHWVKENYNYSRERKSNQFKLKLEKIFEKHISAWVEKQMKIQLQ